MQNYATGKPYENNIQSLLTLGTPHSGIFDQDGTYHGLSFKEGQDSLSFEGCMQISCHEAGEPTPNAYTIDLPPYGIFKIELNDYFGIDKNQGEFIAKIQNTSGEHGLPVDTLALIGLPVKDGYYYKTGDDLITYSGQRFSHIWGNDKIKSTPQIGFGSGKVHEKILGVSVYDKDAVPKGKPSDELINLWSKDNFKGYFHAPFVADKGGAAEAKVEDDSSNFRKTNSPHAALAEIKAWLKPSDAAEVPTVTSATGRIWMDRNLGASRVATSMDDSQSYGDLYQWGRVRDGHEKRSSGTTATLSSSSYPSHSKFILAPSAPNDWRSPQNKNLWQGVGGVNNPCPAGFRVPTANEWQEEIDSWSSQDDAGAFASPLQLPLAGFRDFNVGALNGRGSISFYWSSTLDGSAAKMLQFDSGSAFVGGFFRANGQSIRCIKD